MNDDTKRAIFDELMTASGVVLQRENQFTVREFAESQGITEKMAQRILEQHLADGIVDREKIRTSGGGYVAWGYWKA